MELDGKNACLPTSLIEFHGIYVHCASSRADTMERCIRARVTQHVRVLVSIPLIPAHLPSYTHADPHHNSGAVRCI